MERERVVVYADPDLSDLIPGYLDNRRKDVFAIKAAIVQKDMERIWMIGHIMKGNGSSYGFDAITTYGAALEQGARMRDEESVHQTVSRLESYLDRVEVIYSQPR